MILDYESEDYGKNFHNFEYPKLVMLDSDEPLVAYIEEHEKKLIFTKILDEGFQIVYNLSHFDKRYWEWPIITVRNGRIYLALIPPIGPSDNHDRMQVFLLDTASGQLTSHREWTADLKKDHSVTGLYPYGDRFIGTASYSQICLHYLPFLVFGKMFVFHHNSSFVLDDKDVSKPQPIDHRGCFSAQEAEYAVSDSGWIHGAWIRDTSAAFPPHDETIYYSYTKDGFAWEDPIELYTIRDTSIHGQLEHVSLASGGSSALLLWRDIESGIFFSEMKDGKEVESVKISDIRKMKIPSEPLWSASSIKVAADSRGNAYCLWVQNTGREYRLYFKARINGKWTPGLIVNSGTGYVKLPDMKIDKRGKIHVVYLKSRYPEEARPVKFDCYYMAIERQE